MRAASAWYARRGSSWLNRAVYSFMPKTELAHERLSAGPEIRLSSDRAFGIALGTVLAFAGAAPLLQSRRINRYLLLAAAVVWIGALVRPSLIQPVHRLSTHLAVAINRVTSPILMAILFFGILTPVALLMRLANRRALALDPSPGHWHNREGEAVHLMKAPF
jgi:hypothetical protein